MPQSLLVLFTDFGQAVVAVLIASVLFVFDHVYDRTHLRYWAATFLSLTVAIAAEIAQPLLSARMGPASPALLAVGTIGQVAAYWAGAWLALGTYAVATGRRPPVLPVIAVLAGLVLVGAITQLAFVADPETTYRRYLVHIGVRGLLLGPVVLASAIVLWRIPFREPSRGRRVVAICLALYAGELLHHGLFAVLGLATLTLRYTPWLEVADLVIVVAIGAGFVMWLAEEEKSRGESLSEQIRQSQKMEAVGKLAGGIAHDFNNMLTVILGHYHLLASTLQPGTVERHSVEEIAKAADRGRALTAQLLAFSRKQVMRPREMDLNEVVQQTTSLLRRLLGEDIRLLLHLDGGLRHVRGDRSQLEQVVLNLSVNARDAMPRGGTLEIRTANEERAGESMVVLTVHDTGTGISEAVREKIFEPFFTTKPPGKGTGLGLATVYGIVAQSGGTIELESKVGRGSTFRVLLPGCPVGSAEAGEADSEAIEGAASGTILLVEDESPVRDLTARLLTRAGYRVLQAPDGRTALQIAEVHPGGIDLLLTDVVMPGLSGRELAAVIGVHRPNVSILFMSGYTDDAMLRHGIAEAEMEFLPKPFTMDELLKAVRKAMEGVRPG